MFKIGRIKYLEKEIEDLKSDVKSALKMNRQLVNIQEIIINSMLEDKKKGVELRDCPFCNKAPLVEVKTKTEIRTYKKLNFKTEAEKLEYSIECNNFKCSARPGVKKQDFYEAVRAWNWYPRNTGEGE